MRAIQQCASWRTQSLQTYRGEPRLRWEQTSACGRPQDQRTAQYGAGREAADH